MVSLSFRRKTVFIYLSLFFAVLLLASVIADYVSTIVYEQPNLIPSGWRVSLQVHYIHSIRAKLSVIAYCLFFLVCGRIYLQSRSWTDQGGDSGIVFSR